MGLPEAWAELCKGKTVVLGLKRYAFRRDFTAARLAQLGFSAIEVVDAFDGFQEDVVKELITMGIPINPTLGKGQLGCMCTTIREWKRFLDSGEDYRIFFEDDAIGHLDLPNGLGQQFWNATPKDFELVYLGNMMGTQDAQLKDPNALVVQVPTYTTHAYILSRKGAEKLWSLIQEQKTLNMPVQTIDIQLYLWQVQGRLKWYCWNGTWVQKSYPTFDEGLPWQMFNEVILPQKDTGLVYQNMRLGSTLSHPTLQLTVPQYSI